MANESLNPGLARPSVMPWIVEGAFLALLLLSFIGMQPFALRNPATDLEMGPYSVTGGGDAVRQSLYLVLVLCIGGFALLQRRLGVVRTVPPMLIAAAEWSVAATRAVNDGWEVVPAIVAVAASTACCGACGRAFPDRASSAGPIASRSSRARGRSRRRLASYSRWMRSAGWRLPSGPLPGSRWSRCSSTVIDSGPASRSQRFS